MTGLLQRLRRPSGATVRARTSRLRGGPLHQRADFQAGVSSGYAYSSLRIARRVALHRPHNWLPQVAFLRRPPEPLATPSGGYRAAPAHAFGVILILPLETNLTSIRRRPKSWRMPCRRASRAAGPRFAVVLQHILAGSGTFRSRPRGRDPSPAASLHAPPIGTAQVRRRNRKRILSKLPSAVIPGERRLHIHVERQKREPRCCIPRLRHGPRPPGLGCATQA